MLIDVELACVFDGMLFAEAAHFFLPQLKQLILIDIKESEEITPVLWCVI